MRLTSKDLEHQVRDQLVCLSCRVGATYVEIPGRTEIVPAPGSWASSGPFASPWCPGQSRRKWPATRARVILSARPKSSRGKGEVILAHRLSRGRPPATL